MPIYEFRCEKCQQVFEHLALSASQPAELCCPSCGGEELSRVLSTCASVIGGTSQAPAASASPCLQNRSCQNAGSCSTITLPGHTR
ncbi:MAG: zinc ribbon domain-containing protein [Pseudomonadota bacterium]